MTFLLRLTLSILISVIFFSCKKDIQSERETDLYLGVNNKTVLETMHEMNLLLSSSDFVLLDWKSAKVTYGSNGGKYTEIIVPKIGGNLDELVYVITDQYSTFKWNGLVTVITPELSKNKPE